MANIYEKVYGGRSRVNSLGVGTSEESFALESREDEKSLRRTRARSIASLGPQEEEQFSLKAREERPARALTREVSSDWAFLIDKAIMMAVIFGLPYLIMYAFTYIFWTPGDQAIIDEFERKQWNRDTECNFIYRAWERIQKTRPVKLRGWVLDVVKLILRTPDPDTSIWFFKTLLSYTLPTHAIDHLVGHSRATDYASNLGLCKISDNESRNQVHRALEYELKDPHDGFLIPWVISICFAVGIFYYHFRSRR